MGILTKTEVKSFNLMDASLIAVGVPLVNILGNMVGLKANNLLSGVAKIAVGVAMGIPKDAHYLKIAGASFMVAGVSDLVGKFVPSLALGGQAGNQSQVTIVGGNNSNQGALPNAVL